MKIYSSFEALVMPDTQRVIENAAANCGVDCVSIVWSNENTNEKPIFDAYDENENYLFSVDTDGDVIFEK